MDAPAIGKGGGAVIEIEASDDGDERDSFDAFADSAGIPEEKRDAAYDALQAMIQACIARESSGDYEEE